MAHAFLHQCKAAQSTHHNNNNNMPQQCRRNVSRHARRCAERTYAWPTGASGQIWTKENVPAGQLPPPLRDLFTQANVILVGAGSDGALSAALLAQTRALRILVLDDAGTIDYHEERFLPGNENEVC